MSTIITPMLNMGLVNWREFPKGFKDGDISDTPQPTTLSKDQIIDDVRIPEQAKFPLNTDKNTSLLKITNGKIQPVPLHVEGINSGVTNVMMITGCANYPTVAYATGVTAMQNVLTTGFIITGDNTVVYSAQKREMAPMSVSWNFSDINGYDGRRVDFAYIRASVEVRRNMRTTINPSATMEYGGGLYIDMFNTGTWVPIYTAGYLSMKTFMVPVNPYNQTSIRLMTKDCYNWSVQFLGIITGA